MIGLSLGFCVYDIARGRVTYESVDKIIAGTKVMRPEDWEEVVASYKQSYWRDYPEAQLIFRRLLAEGKVEQSKLRDGTAPFIGDGRWAETEDQIKWC